MISKQLLSGILRSLLRPLVRFCLRHAIKVQHVDEFVRRGFVEEASRELEKLGKKPTASSVSAMTGLQRRDVERYRSAPIAIDDKGDVVRRVMGLWQTGAWFTTADGAPRVLSFGSEGSEFHELVESVSRDKNPASILQELERLSLVTRSLRGVRLVVGSFAPRGDIERGYQVVSDDIESLLHTAERNLLREDDAPALHVRTAFDRVRLEALPEIGAWLMKEGHAFHARARAVLSRHDQDINPKRGFTGETTTVSLSAFAELGEKSKEYR